MATKTTRKKKTAPAEPAVHRKPGAGRLHVRMYRQGLGDCFLITAPDSTGKPFHMLIDCGVVLGTEKPAEIMTKVVNDIIAVTGNGAGTKGQIDLLVATHEHWDHVSGFGQVQELFDKHLDVKHVWVAWTEDPKDKLAAKLRKERRSAENALRMAVNHLALHGMSETAQRVDSLVGFFGAKSGSTEDALNYVKKLVDKPRFCEPGEPPITLPNVPSLRFWILGPPKDEKLIKKSNPGKGEAYGLDAGPDGSQAFLVSALTRGMAAASAGDSAPADDSVEEPFDRMYAIPMPRGEHVPFFATRYYGDCTDGSIYDKAAEGDACNIRNQSWRRIDSTWMESSETMALQLDSATNNTSLVIAIELVEPGQQIGPILLFPGDAQAGNWLSWQNLKWTLDGPKSDRKIDVTGPQLLARTIFYKVGHHGSHNATLKAKGLELMVGDDIIAMIPVDHAMAVKKRWGRMPLPDLVKRIREKTNGRVLCVDDKVKTDADLAKAVPKGVALKDWKQFTDRVTATELYYELSF